MQYPPNLAVTKSPITIKTRLLLGFAALHRENAFRELLVFSMPPILLRQEEGGKASLGEDEVSRVHVGRSPTRCTTALATRVDRSNNRQEDHNRVAVAGLAAGRKAIFVSSHLR
jgi:hypothetical protein